MAAELFVCVSKHQVLFDKQGENFKKHQSHKHCISKHCQSVGLVR